MRIRDYVAVVLTVAVSNLFFLYLQASFFYLHHQNPAQSSVVDAALHAAMLRRLTSSEEGCHCHCHSADSATSSSSSTSSSSTTTTTTSSSSSTAVVPVASNKAAAPLFRPIVQQVTHQQPSGRTATNPEESTEVEEDDGAWPPRKPRADPNFSLRDVRQAILKHHELMKARHPTKAILDVTEMMARHTPRDAKMMTISAAPLETMWMDEAGSRERVYTLHCSYFDPFCLNATERSLAEEYRKHYVAPRYYPSAGEVVKMYFAARLASSLANVLEAENQPQVALLRRGANANPPHVGVAYDGWVSRTGTILTADIFVPGWSEGSTANEFVKATWFTTPTPSPSQKVARKAAPSPDNPALVGYRSTSARSIEWIKVDEVVVISHVHQGMFWHWMVSELFRLANLIPFLQANPEVFIHLGHGNKVLERDFLGLFNISMSRVIVGMYVEAEVIYYAQFINRDDIPSLGLTRMLADHIHDAVGIPKHRRISVLSPEVKEDGLTQEKSGQDEAAPEIEVNILCIVRSDWYKARIVNNYADLKREILQLSETYPTKLMESGAQERVRITMSEHWPNMSLPHTLSLYANADIIFGPHGAGFANVFAARAGAHVIELVTGRHLNVLSSARLGVAYHGVVANSTKQGVHPDSKSTNFIANVTLIMEIVETILDQRFLPEKRARSEDVAPIHAVKDGSPPPPKVDRPSSSVTIAPKLLLAQQKGRQNLRV